MQKRMKTQINVYVWLNYQKKTSVEAVETLVKHEQDWIPTAPETSLYIRPFMFATEPGVGVHPATI